MAVIDAQGTTFSVANASAVQVSIGGFRSFSGFDGEAADRDRTTLASTAREYAPGLPDYGNFTMELFVDTADAGQNELLAIQASQSTRTFVLTLENAVTYTFQGYVKSASTEGDLDSDLIRNVNIKITGAPAIA